MRVAPCASVSVLQSGEGRARELCLRTRALGRQGAAPGRARQLRARPGRCGQAWGLSCGSGGPSGDRPPRSGRRPPVPATWARAQPPSGRDRSACRYPAHPPYLPGRARDREPTRPRARQQAAPSAGAEPGDRARYTSARPKLLAPSALPPGRRACGRAEARGRWGGRRGRRGGRRCRWGGRRRRWRRGIGARVKATGAGPLAVGTPHARRPHPDGAGAAGGGAGEAGAGVAAATTRPQSPSAATGPGTTAGAGGGLGGWGITRTGIPHGPSTHCGSSTSAYRTVASCDTVPPVEAAAGLESREEVLLNALPLPGAHAFWPAANRETDTASALDTLRAAIAHAAENCPMLRDQSSFIRATSMAASITAGIDRNGSSHDVANGTA